jgi:hypothetical protein
VLALELEYGTGVGAGVGLLEKGLELGGRAGVMVLLVRDWSSGVSWSWC